MGCSCLDCKDFFLEFSCSIQFFELLLSSSDEEEEEIETEEEEEIGEDSSQEEEETETDDDLVNTDNISNNGKDVENVNSLFNLGVPKMDF